MAKQTGTRLEISISQLKDNTWTWVLAKGKIRKHFYARTVDLAKLYALEEVTTLCGYYTYDMESVRDSKLGDLDSKNELCISESQVEESIEAICRLLKKSGVVVSFKVKEEESVDGQES